MSDSPARGYLSTVFRDVARFLVGSPRVSTTRVDRFPTLSSVESATLLRYDVIMRELGGSRARNARDTRVATERSTLVRRERMDGDGEGTKRIGQDRGTNAEQKGEVGSIASVCFNAIKYRCVQLKRERVTRSRVECRYKLREPRKSKRIAAIRFDPAGEKHRSFSFHLSRGNIVIFPVSLIPSFARERANPFPFPFLRSATRKSARIRRPRAARSRVKEIFRSSERLDGRILRAGRGKGGRGQF